jgi:hypothetical protein
VNCEIWSGAPTVDNHRGTMTPQPLRMDLKRDRCAGRRAGELINDAGAGHAYRGGLGSDVLDAQRFEIVSADCDAIDAVARWQRA